MAKSSSPPKPLSLQIIERWGRRKLTALTPRDEELVGAINAPYLEAAAEAAQAAHAPDTAWLIHRWCSPRDLGRVRGPQLPDLQVVLRAINVIENRFTDRRRTLPRRKIREPLARMWELARVRREDKRWRELNGSKFFSARQLQRWYERIEAGARDLTVLPTFAVPGPFTQALELVQIWDELLARRGHVGERFSLLEELCRLHNWPGDQWNTGDDFASAQERFHRRLERSQARRDDPIRDQIMRRALFLREGLLTDPLDPLEWFLAAAAYSACNPQVLLPWSRRDYNLLGEVLDEWRSRRHRIDFRFTANDSSLHRVLTTPLEQVPRESLRAVSGPAQMIDLDEDVVASLPPGCRVRRLVVSQLHPLGPDWMVYWVDMVDYQAEPIVDLVESAKLRPPILFVTNGAPESLARAVRPFLGAAFTIPTHPLTAWARPRHFDDAFTK